MPGRSIVALTCQRSADSPIRPWTHRSLNRTIWSGDASASQRRTGSVASQVHFGRWSSGSSAVASSQSRAWEMYSVCSRHRIGWECV